MPPLSFLIKPASGGCNMRCKYCFYADETSLRTVPSFGLMNSHTLDALVKTGIETADGECTFAFQGGEPTLVGLGFFRELVALTKKYARPNVRVNFALQTNGMLLDDEWAAFFRENRFLIGLSLDGPREIHDNNRLLANHSGSYSRVMKAAKTLEQHGVEFNILTVVTRQTARHTEKIYRFLMNNGFHYQQYIPCLDPLEEERGGQVYSLRPEDYTAFLKKLFDLWYDDIVHGRQVYIRYFENLVGMLLGRPPEQCGMFGHCMVQYVIEADGGAYPCDFYVLDEYLLGNINTDTIEQLDARRRQIGFIEQSVPAYEDCLSCQWRQLCRGGCRRDRDYAGQEALGKNYFCAAYQSFFTYAYPRLQHMAREISRNGG